MNQIKNDNMNTIKVIDYSDETGFAFGFVCGLCGFEWRTDHVPFRINYIAEVLDKQELDLLWEEERARVYDQVKIEAAIQFNKCPECGIWVCDDCFYVAEAEITDFCLECLEEFRV